MSNSEPNIRTIDLSDLFAAIAGSRIGGGDRHSERPVSEDIATLKALAERYTAPNPFSVGDLVTPRADSMLKTAGRPYVVLELAETADNELSSADPTHVDHIRFGAKLDIRVASVCSCPNGVVIASWEEGWMFEPYTQPSEDRAPAPTSSEGPAEPKQPAPAPSSHEFA